MAQRFAVLAVFSTSAALAYDFNHDQLVTDKFIAFANNLKDVTHFESELGTPAQHQPLDDGKLPLQFKPCYQLT